MKKNVIFYMIIAMVLFQVPSSVNAADTQKSIKRINRTIFDMQQEFLQIKEEFTNRVLSWKKQQRDFELVVEGFKKENSQLKNQVKSLQSQVEKFEETLENSTANQVQSEVDEMSRLIQSLVLQSLGEHQVFKPMLLNLINNPKSRLPKDLLLLYLAKSENIEGNTEKSIGYYTTLLSDFPKSKYIFRALYDLSELFESAQKVEEQLTLLRQLASSQLSNIYVQQAKEKLFSLGEPISGNGINGSSKPETSESETSTDFIVDQPTEESF